MLNYYKFELMPWVYEHGMLGDKSTVFKLTVRVNNEELVRQQVVNWDMSAHESPIRFYTNRMVEDLERHLEKMEVKKDGS